MSEPRGLRLNNPGNIRRTSDKWKGLADVQEDKEFFTFTEMKWGYRALMKLLLNYHTKYGCTTVPDYIKRYAPYSENNTAAYIKTVCKKLGVKEDEEINIENKDTLCQFAAAISYVENGREGNYKDIYNGYELL